MKQSKQKLNESKSKLDKEGGSKSVSILKTSGGFPNATASQLPTKNSLIYDFIKQNIILELLEKSVNIGEFRKVHKINQKNYENRNDKKELNFISNDYKMPIPDISGTSKIFVSNNTKSLYLFDVNCKFYDLDLNSKQNVEIKPTNISEQQRPVLEIKPTNIFEQQRPVLDVEYYDRQRLFFLLFNNLNFTIFNYEKYKLPGPETHFERLFKARTQYFSFRKYLNYVNDEELSKLRFNQQSIIKIKSRDLVMLNLTYFSDRIITFDTVNCTIKYNIYINPMNFSFLIPSNTFQSFKFYLKFMISKNWNVHELAEFQDFSNNLNINTCSKDGLYKNIYNLVEVFYRYNNDKHKDKFQDLKFLDFERHDYDTKKKAKYFRKKPNNIILELTTLKQALLELSLKHEEFKEDQDLLKDFDFVSLTNYYNVYFKRVYEISKLFEENNLTTGNIFNYILRLLKRGIDLEKIIKEYDKENNYYIPKLEFKRIISSMPIGITPEEVKQLLDTLLYDEFNNILYPYMFENLDYMILKSIFKKKADKMNKHCMGYFSQNKHDIIPDKTIVEKNLIDIHNKFYKITDRFDDNVNYGKFKTIPVILKKTEGDQLMKVMNYMKSETDSFVVDPLFFKHFNIHIEIDNYIFISNLNLFLFTHKISSCSKISILKLKSSKITKYDKIQTDLVNLGYIETFSSQPPKLLNYIEERNLVLAQVQKENKTQNSSYNYKLMNEICVNENFNSIYKTMRSLHHGEENEGKYFL